MQVTTDVYALKPGQDYSVSFEGKRGLPLVSDPDPADPVAEMRRFDWLSSPVRFRVMSRRDTRLDAWYRVRIGEKIGYFNIQALLSLSVEEV